MHKLTALLAALVVFALPRPVLAGTFTVPFGNGTPMGAAGWVANPQAGAICGYEGIGTLWLNAGTLPAHNGCFYLFNAPAAAQIVSVNVTHSYVKASAATALCTYSFAAVAGDTIRHCASGSFGDAIAASGAAWVELGIYNESASPISLATARANNAVYAGGVVTLADPTPPGLAASGPSGVQTGLSAGLQWSASDPESGAPSVGYKIDGGAMIALRGQACSWLCGTGASGAASVDLSPLADGLHSITVYASSYADAAATVGPLPFQVDRTAPAQPVIGVTPDAHAPAPGWWGHGPVALTTTTTTAGDVANSRVLVYAPSGAVVFDETTGGSVATTLVPAAAFTTGGTYDAAVVQCDGAGHCIASDRAQLHWDGASPAVAADGTAGPLGMLAARDGAHMLWPGAGAETGGSGIAGGYLGIGATPAAARAAALASDHWTPGNPGVTEAIVPASSIHGADRACLAVRPLSGAGIAAESAGVRCAAVDEQPPAVDLLGAVRWSGGSQRVTLAVSDASGAVISQVLLDGAPVVTDGGWVTIAGEGAHVLRVVAHDAAGNETVAERALGVDATPPSIGAVAVDFLAREIRVDVGDALSGVALAEIRLGSVELETRISVDGRAAIARVPAGLSLDRAAVSVRVLDASEPFNVARLAATLPARQVPVMQGLAAIRGRVLGRVVAGSPSQVRIWAYPKGREPQLLGTFATGSGGRFVVRVKPARTTRYAVALPETQHLRGLGAHIAGTLRVDARIRGLRIRVRGDNLVVRARFDGRGEATRLHLLVNDVLGGRWVEGCLEHGRPAVHLEPTGRVWGTCAIPASARGRAWTYRLVLAAPSSTWPWRTPSSASVSLLLPF